MERDNRNLYFYNLEGSSYADAWQVDVSAPLAEGLDLFAAFRYNDSKISYTDVSGNRHKMEKTAYFALPWPSESLLCHAVPQMGIRCHSPV